MRCELADYEWAAIKPMLPNKPRVTAAVHPKSAQGASERRNTDKANRRERI
jgi:hypothetical protein